MKNKHSAKVGREADDPFSPPPVVDGSWLLSHKVEIPDPIPGYLERPTLEARCCPTARRLTVLHAPGGFGKTALLARCCHALREQDVAVAWLAVDEDDGPVSLASYLWLAFEQAGVSVLDPDGDRHDSASVFAAHPATDSAADYRVSLLLRAVRRHARPCVLAIDELDRLNSPETVVVLNTVLQRAPPNLHFAMTFRECPHGLDVAMFSLEGRGETLTAEDLRFSGSQIVRFFDPRDVTSPAGATLPGRPPRLSRAQLASVTENSAGWPIALRLYRNALHAGTPPQELGASVTVAAWIESRLWRGLSEEDRDLVLDIALFDRIEPRLVDEATGRTQSRLRLSAMASLSGLLQTAGGDASAMSLHPLIREYCAARLFRVDPARFRRIHVGIANALARRGQVLDALRHASEAGDDKLTGSIAERAGGVKLWLRHGAEALRALDGWLTEDVLAAHPRLALVRCIALTFSGDIEGARRVYQSAAVSSVGFNLDGSGQEDEELRSDHLLALGMFAILGCKQIDHYPPLLSTGAKLIDRSDLNPVLRSVLRVGMSTAHNEMAQFEQAELQAESARTGIGPNAPYVLPYLYYQLGLTAMARGQAEQAERRYQRGQNIAQGRADDTGMVMFGTLFRAELELERSAATAAPTTTPVSIRLLGEYGAWFDVYAAGVGVGWELACDRVSHAEAVATIERASEFALATDRPALVRLLGALRVSALLLDANADEAERAWRAAQLPESDESCVDLRSQRWREMEAIACARLRLLTVQGRIGKARKLARALRGAAAKRSLLRTLMRALALSARLEHEASDPANAARYLAEALLLLRRTGYARPLFRERGAIVPLLEALPDSEPSEPVLDDARRIHAVMTAQPAVPPAPDRQLLSPKELEVLRRLATHTDNDIARELTTSYDSVRYYVRKLFDRFGVRNRFDATHRARSMGLLPDAGTDDAPV